MSERQAERTVVMTMRLLAAAFAVVGVLFIAVPDTVIETIDDVGAALGDFTTGPETDQRLWLGLAFAYMVVITGLALSIQADVARFRPLLLVLAAGKAASSLAAGAFFLFDEDVFAYLLNFMVDGSLVGIALACWVLAGRVGRSRPAGGSSPAAHGSDLEPAASPVAGGSGPATARKPADGGAETPVPPG